MLLHIYIKIIFTVAEICNIQCSTFSLSDVIMVYNTFYFYFKKSVQTDSSDKTPMLFVNVSSLIEAYSFRQIAFQPVI